MRIMDKVVAVFALYMVAAASFSGYFSKWSFYDGSSTQSLHSIVVERADRPFVYRQLVPYILRQAPIALSPDTLAAAERRLAKLRGFAPDKIFAKASDLQIPGFRLQYFIAYYLTFASFFVSGLLIWRLSVVSGYGTRVGLCAAAAFLLAYPLLLTGGGYFYDSFELCFLLASVLCALREKMAALVLITVVATLNKESYLAFIPTLFPLLAHMSRRRRLAWLGFVAAIAFAINLLVKSRYRDLPGGVLEVHIIGKLQFLADPRSYVRFEPNYGVISTKGFNLVHIAVVCWLCVNSWGDLPVALRNHAKIALALNIPLFMLFSWQDELRNMSFVFPTLTLMLCALFKEKTGFPSSAELVEGRHNVTP